MSFHPFLKIRVGGSKLNSLAALLAILAIPALAQNRNAGEIRGTVFDQTGASIPTATVTILNKQTGVSKTLTTAGTVFMMPRPSSPEPTISRLLKRVSRNLSAAT